MPFGATIDLQARGDSSSQGDAAVVFRKLPQELCHLELVIGKGQYCFCSKSAIYENSPYTCVVIEACSKRGKVAITSKPERW
ncbi:hypothetical protein QE152_g8500 [Popillia japonica]|uniref:Uncharacterized protein n=1 Tax=Popillia japonica TaxID=7064 RepID=A0AAW1MBE5_POPJA